MGIKTVVLTFLLINNLSIVAFSEDKKEEEKKVEETVSIAMPQATEVVLEKYKYKSVSPDFWEKVSSLIEKKKPVEVFELVYLQENRFGAGTPEGKEAILAIAQYFYENKYPYAAYHLYLTLAKENLGTELASQSLYMIAEIYKRYDFDFTDLKKFIDNNEFEFLHPEIADFVFYIKGVELLKFRYEKWAKSNLIKIRTGSYWDLERKYWSGVAMVANDNIEGAFKRFQELKAFSSIDHKLKINVDKQLARIYFEKENYEMALELYSGLNILNLMEKRRILLEVAWTKFYLEQYDKALGALHAMKSPYFRNVISPENYILEMLIYQKLCHYNLTKEVEKQFKDVFKKSIVRIRRRRPLIKDQNLFSIAAMNLKYQHRVNQVSIMREERKTLLKEKAWKKYRFFDELSKAYKKKEYELRMLIDYNIDEDIRIAANELMFSLEQVNFISYTSELNAIRINQMQSATEYRKEKIKKFTFDKIYWPIQEEYWFDEIDKYTVVINNNCVDARDDKNKKLEENFK